MSNRNFKRVFKDRKELDRMLFMRQSGWVQPSLAIFFDVDHTSVFHWCEKMHVGKASIQSLSFSIPKIVKLVGVKKSGPKTYAEYLQEYKDRHPNLEGYDASLLVS